MDAAKFLLCSSGALVAVSGVVDFVTDGNLVVGAHNGVAMMRKITATGCAVTAITTAFVGSGAIQIFRCHCLCVIFGFAGELIMDMEKGPASLRMHMIDSLHGLDAEAVASRVRISSLCWVLSADNADGDYIDLDEYKSAESTKLAECEAFIQ